MATVQKYAALPIEKYLEILEKIKKDNHSTNIETSPPPVTYQNGAGSTKPATSSNVPIVTSTKQTTPPPGMPIDTFTSDSSIGDSDNWLDVWQALD